jgi:hypothetical protein
VPAWTAINMRLVYSLLWAVAYAQTEPQNRIREFPNCVDGPLASNKICDTSASPSERAAALVAIMEPEEKLLNIKRYVLAATLLLPRAACGWDAC